MMHRRSIISMLLAAVLPLYAEAPGGGGGDPPPPNNPQTPPPGGGDPPPQTLWYDSFKDQATKDWLKSYQNAYPDAESVANKAMNLEKFVGADKAGRGVIVPGPSAKPEDWQAFYRKVGGVPEKPDGYKLPPGLDKDPMAVAFREFAHSKGIPPMFHDAALEFYTAQAKKTVDTQVAEFERRGEQEMNELRTEWQGNDYVVNVELGKRAAKAFLPHESPEQLQEMITKMEGALGTKMVMKMFAQIGKSIGEHGFVEGDTPVNSGGMDPNSAKARIVDLQRDKDWQKRFIAGGADEKAEWERLHKVAYGQTA
jgi:hypothetical protein